MSRTSALRAQHDRIEQLAGKLDREVMARREGDDCDAIALLLAKLLGVLRIHLATEDQSLYPYMIDSGDQHASGLVQHFQDEMGGLAGTVSQFAERWTCARTMESGFADFRHELVAILSALSKRIARENDQLYPLADELAERQQRMSA
ncbi:hemerythrin domain-containing protein [Sphingomicrobium clamense]|uniref:Hemerythrin domain-containing protein n=1 Tax=Sphingomicrobium clamense TaxID=2851013 RepID=A0ABS6V429_9SPHN|nr:hemerythrin domain-containing protein [Sphingomicrobium sp. B8]MBW0144303.1 hemerythrin domain-containing protein [Sphingomicrobium sp. B8]